MSVQLTDERAYNPMCGICGDEGCDICEPVRARLVQYKCDEEQKLSLQEKAARFVREKCAVNGAPRTEAQLVALVADAMRVAVQDATGVQVDDRKRFHLLEYRK